MSYLENDEELALSSSALDALKEFYAERNAREEQFVKLHKKAEELHAAVQPLSMDAFTEDWNHSQFWYSEEYASFLAKQLLKDATSDMTIGVVSTPSVFIQLKNIINASSPSDPKPKLILFEYDRRFAIFPEFVFYDYAHPTKLPPELKSTCDRIVLDPPFLSEDCQTKSAITVQWLSKPLLPPSVTNGKANGAGTSTSNGRKFSTRVIICTGERMETLIHKLYGKPFGVYTTDYEPEHARGLGNVFYCYANFDSPAWKVREQDEGGLKNMDS